MHVVRIHLVASNQDHKNQRTNKKQQTDSLLSTVTMKFSLFSSFLLLLATGRPAGAYVSFDTSVVCDDANPGICRGMLYLEGPSPALFDGSEDIVYVGRFLWNYRFVRGLPEGYMLEGLSTDYGIHEYGPTVEIEMDVDGLKCTITVGDETCNSCEPCGVDGDTFSADCTNLQTQHYVANTGAGKLMECEPALPFFYPLEIPEGMDGLPDLPVLTSAPPVKQEP